LDGAITLQFEVLEGVSKLRYPPEIIESCEPTADILSDRFPWKSSKINWKLLAWQVDDNGSWCLAITSEGYIDFGFAL
jgi:hypothetical protein